MWQTSLSWGHRDVGETISRRRAHSRKKLHRPVRFLAQNMFVVAGFIATISGDGGSDGGQMTGAYLTYDAPSRGQDPLAGDRDGAFHGESVWGVGEHNGSSRVVC